MPNITPLTIITGYLGSGKTTLVRHIIKSVKKRKLAILLNEFGELAIDSKVIKGKNVDMKEISGGCVCCSLTGELEAAIKEILAEIKPDHIVIETTGVAEPDGIIVSVESIPNVKLDAVITVADADAFVRYPSLGHTGIVQLEMADLILLNKRDLVDEKDLQRIEMVLGKINDRAAIIRTANGKVD